MFCAQKGPVFSLFSFRYSTRFERFLIFAISGLFSLAPCLKMRCTRCLISFGYGINFGHSHLDRATFFRAWFVLFLTVVIFQLIRLVYVIYILLLIFPQFLLQLHCQFLQNLGRFVSVYHPLPLSRYRTQPYSISIIHTSMPQCLVLFSASNFSSSRS